MRIQLWQFGAACLICGCSLGEDSATVGKTEPQAKPKLTAEQSIERIMGSDLPDLEKGKQAVPFIKKGMPVKTVDKLMGVRPLVMIFGLGVTHDYMKYGVRIYYRQGDTEIRQDATWLDDNGKPLPINKK